MIDFKKLSLQYRNELLDNAIPFWLNHSQDLTNGGYFTCLDRQGNTYDTDKFIWLQGRQVWMFSMLYNNVEKRQEWLDCAVQGGEFLKWRSGNSAKPRETMSMQRSQRKHSTSSFQKETIRKENGIKHSQERET